MSVEFVLGASAIVVNLGGTWALIAYHAGRTTKAVEDMKENLIQTREDVKENQIQTREDVKKLEANVSEHAVKLGRIETWIGLEKLAGPG